MQNQVRPLIGWELFFKGRRTNTSSSFFKLLLHWQWLLCLVVCHTFHLNFPQELTVEVYGYYAFILRIRNWVPYLFFWLIRYFKGFHCDGLSWISGGLQEWSAAVRLQNKKGASEKTRSSLLHLWLLLNKGTHFHASYTTQEMMSWL